MIKVEVKASKKYDILIDGGLLDRIGKLSAPFMKTKKCVVVTDSNVAPLYLEMVKKSLENEGVNVKTFVFPAGEKSKNGNTYLSLLNFMAEEQLCRNDMLFALGGGVVGDMSGFAAATFLRGIPYIQIPTTILAAVDSSVGGKTAIDLDKGKNLAGAFYQPSLVVCDTDTLKTIDDENYKGSMAEVIKYAIIRDRELFSYLEKGNCDMAKIIETCVSIKSQIVENDEFDKGERQLLNFGHTIGHAVECDANFEIIHGKAVAIGMAKMALCAEKNKLCTKECAEKIISLIEKYNLPTDYDIDKEKLISLMLSDKKVMGEKINLIVPREIGNCEIYPVSRENLSSFLEGGKNEN